MYLYLPSQNLLISNEGSYSLDNFDVNNFKNFKNKYNIWKELNWYSAKPSNWRGLYCNILRSSTNMYMTHFDQKMKPYLYFEKTKAAYFVVNRDYYFYMTSLGLQVNKKQLLNYTYYNNQEKKYYRFLFLDESFIDFFIKKRKYTNFKVRIIDIGLEKL